MRPEDDDVDWPTILMMAAEEEAFEEQMRLDRLRAIEADDFPAECDLGLDLGLDVTGDASPVEGTAERSSAISKELQRLNAKWWAEQRDDETKKRGTNDT